jgi:hypothetical protein
MRAAWLMFVWKWIENGSAKGVKIVFFISCDVLSIAFFLFFCFVLVILLYVSLFSVLLSWCCFSLYLLRRYKTTLRLFLFCSVILLLLDRVMWVNTRRKKAFLYIINTVIRRSAEKYVEVGRIAWKCFSITRWNTCTRCIKTIF